MAAEQTYTLNPSIGDEDAMIDKIIRRGVRLLVLHNKNKGAPVARYDFEAKRPYLEYADGDVCVAEDNCSVEAQQV